MLPFISSLTFLYAFCIAVMLFYGMRYYRNFARNGYQPRLFPWVWLSVAAACFFFLFINMQAPLSLRSYSNTDHHFLRHEGFRVAGRIELGKTDTLASGGNSYNRFVFSRSGGQLRLQSDYSEDPFYIASGPVYQLASVVHNASGHALSFRAGSAQVQVRVTGDSTTELQVNGETLCRVSKLLRVGSNCWNIFRDDPGFVNTSWYTYEPLLQSLQSVFLLRDDLSRTKHGALKFFIAGRFFNNGQELRYDGQPLQRSQFAFSTTIPDQSSIAWGIGFLDNNRNQYRISAAGADSFYLRNKFPVAYPLSEENRKEWQPHTVSKFLLADPRDLQALPPVFNEGFMVAPFPGDSGMPFAPVLLSYQKDRGGAGLALQARSLEAGRAPVDISGNRLLLPAGNASLHWVFSIQNSFDWNFGSFLLSASRWKALMLGSLFLLVILVFTGAWLQPAQRLSWVWQLLAVLSLVMLTTRFFLYWRYKSFPPYEGLDLPSLQQLNSWWNFGVIVAVTLLLAFLFGFGVFRQLAGAAGRGLARLRNQPYRPVRAGGQGGLLTFISKRKNSLLQKMGSLPFFLLAWLGLLAGGAGLALFSGFDPGICRHLSLALALLYFFFLHRSYLHSPLAAAREKSWWAIRTGSTSALIFNNPVKVLLSVSLLGVFAFIDIGVAIIFLNFLLFQEAFLCINYAIAGLATGSKRNAGLFAMLALCYLLLFAANLLAGPYLFHYLLELPPVFFAGLYAGFALFMAAILARLLHQWPSRKRALAVSGSALLLFFVSFFFFPKEKILEKAAVTKYRIDVMTMPVDQALETAYRDGKTYEPVIRAAQNQWFINTFIYEKNNPAVNQAAFTLLPHAPQHKGARYNAQATDLVASRFLIAEHGKWSVLLYVLLLLLPATLLASFYKLYPDFTNRVNPHYAAITTGFSLLNYLLITALLVILAATGRYIFFGQDLPFGSILSKQSLLFPAAILVSVLFLFRNIPLEQYPNRRKMLPGALVFAGLAVLLFIVQPTFNKDREFGMSDLAKNMDATIETRLQPVFDYYDTAKSSRRLSMQDKDRLFTDSLRKMIASGTLQDAGRFFARAITQYTRGSFIRHLDQRNLLFLDRNSGKPQLAVNDNYFRVEPPPHLQQNWKGNIYGDTTRYHVTLWNESNGQLSSRELDPFFRQGPEVLSEALQLVTLSGKGEGPQRRLGLVNQSGSSFQVEGDRERRQLAPNDTLLLSNPSRYRLRAADGKEQWLTVEPDLFMRNLYVNGSRYYSYPMGNRFIWARHFAESIASASAGRERSNTHAFLSLDAVLMDSLSLALQRMMTNDTAYAKGSEYGICIADDRGRLLALTDHISGPPRPDPNDKAAFQRVLLGENGLVSQSLLRKQVGNINLLRMNPGPGSTLKPVVFAAIASQLKLDWDAFAAEGFSEKQQYFGGEKVAPYDFEKNNGRISNVVDYLRYSDNYYHSNLLLLGSYSAQNPQSLLSEHFSTRNGAGSYSWPYFTYNGRQYWLQGFRHWPGYEQGRADFGSDSSFVSRGLMGNFGIYTRRTGRGSERFASVYDSLLFRDAWKKSGFILPEYALFDQKGTGMDTRKPNEVFMSSFRGHVKGSSQVMIPPVKMLDAFGRLVSQNRNYGLTLNPYAETPVFLPFRVGDGVRYTDYLSLMREKVFEGLKQALFSGTAARLGAQLKNGSPYFYYAKTGTTGNEESDAKSKLFALVISEKDLTDPDFNFRDNRFFTIYFTSQNGPAKQNEAFQAEVIRMVQESGVFKKYMRSKT